VLHFVLYCYLYLYYCLTLCFSLHLSLPLSFSFALYLFLSVFLSPSLCIYLFLSVFLSLYLLHSLCLHLSVSLHCVSNILKLIACLCPLLIIYLTSFLWLLQCHIILYCTQCRYTFVVNIYLFCDVTVQRHSFSRRKTKSRCWRYVLERHSCDAFYALYFYLLSLNVMSTRYS